MYISNVLDVSDTGEEQKFKVISKNFQSDSKNTHLWLN